MPWERDLSVNAYRFGKPSPKARGKWKKLRVRKPHVQDWMETLQWLVILERLPAIAEGRQAPHINLPVHIKVNMRFPDKRKRDDHNYHKVIADAVSKALCIDDQHIRISTGTIERRVGKGDAGFRIEVSDEPIG